MHPLEAWRQSQGLTLIQLGRLIGTSDSAAGRYCRGRVPQPDIVLRLYQVTCGAVEPNDLYDLAAVDMSDCKPCCPASLPPDALVASGIEP